MERKKRLYDLILEIRRGAEARDIGRVKKANINFSRLYQEEFGGEEYISGTLIANLDRARNNYLNSFSENLPKGCYTSEKFLEEANKYFAQIEKQLFVERK